MQLIKITFLISVYIVVTMLRSNVAFSETNRKPAASLVPFHAQYKGYRFGMAVGDASIQLEAMPDNQYKLTYKSKASLFFLTDKRYETSIFTITENGIVPYKYSYRRDGTGKDKKIEVLFDEKTQRIHIDKKDVFAWQGELDNQLFRLDIQRKLSAGEDKFYYKLVNDRGQLREYRLNVIGKEQLNLPFGKLEGIKVEIVREKQNRRKTYVWFSPELDFQLVRLQQFKDGEEQGDIRLSKFHVKS